MADALRQDDHEQVLSFAFLDLRATIAARREATIGQHSRRIPALHNVLKHVLARLSPFNRQA
jgi:hypothetical protein